MAEFIEHVHVSEREVEHRWPDGRLDDARWEDCLWASAVEWVRATGRPVPPTHAEAEALRAASGQGPAGGSTFADLARGLQARYGLVMPSVRYGWQAVTSAFVPGRASIVTGSMGAFPAGHRLRRWDPGFAGAHAVFVESLPTGEAVWCDPLAPAVVDGRRWTGELVGRAEVETFMKMAGAGAVIGEVKRGGDVMVVVVRERPFLRPRRFRIAAGKTIHGYDPARPGRPVVSRVWKEASSADAIAEVWVSYPDVTNPPVPRGGPFLKVSNGVYVGLLVVAAEVSLDPEPDPVAEVEAKWRRWLATAPK
jgi:hypothetical protein